MNNLKYQNNNLQNFNNDSVITEGWYWALQSKKLKSGKVIGVRLSGKDLAIFRTHTGKVVALDAFCPHRGAHLGRGSVEGEGLRCYYHRWKFDESGQCVDVPCLEKAPKAAVSTYLTADHYGLIWIWIGQGEPHHLPEVPELAGEEVEVSFAKPYVKGCHPNVVMSDAIDVQHFRSVHRIPGDILSLEGVQINGHTMRYDNVASAPKNSVVGRILRHFYQHRLTYSLCYWNGCSGSVTVGPDFQHFHVMYANRLGENGVSEGQVVLLTKRRKTRLGRWYGRVLLFLTKLVSDYFAHGDTPQFNTIKFDFKTPIRDDKTILQFIHHVESLPAADWGFSKPCRMNSKDQQSIGKADTKNDESDLCLAN